MLGAHEKAGVSTDAGFPYTAAKQADKPDSVHAPRPKTRPAWQPFL
ncbi:hypothetical protein OKW28_006686 [Paraburkholderia sp. 40]